MYKLKLLPFIVLICYGINLQSQSFWEWTEPVSLTDSLSDNHNPYMIRSLNNQGEQLFMVWEKHVDSLTTDLYIDNILDSLPEELILHNNATHLSHPLLLHMPYPVSQDSLFFLFYETSENGSQDIRYGIYRANGSITESVDFATTDGDESQLDINGGYWFKAGNKWALNNLVWINDGKLCYSELQIEDDQWSFTTPIVIDSNTCSNPVVTMQQPIYYLKDDGTGNNHVYRAHKTYQSGWEIMKIYDEGHCLNLYKDRVLSDYLCWTANIDSVWKPIFYYWDQAEELELESDEAFDPALMGNDIITKSTDQNYQYVHIAMPHMEAGYDELYMNPEPYNSLWFENFTLSSMNNKNPAFFGGEYVGSSCIYTYLVWEAAINDHWQLRSSKILLCIGGIEENESNALEATVFPNPFSNEVKIGFTLRKQSQTTLQIFDQAGQEVYISAIGLLQAGSHQLQWADTDLPAGVYVVKLTAGDEIFTSKVIKE